MRFILNGTPVTLPDTAAGDPLLFVLGDDFGLHGPRYGCGVGACGACTVLVDGEARRACVTAAADVAGAEVTTLEGLSGPEGLHPLQQAWLDESVPQCGYCQNGQIMTAAGLLASRPDAGAAEIAAAMDDVVCRCGTQARVRRAVVRAQRRMQGRT